VDGDTEAEGDCCGSSVSLAEADGSGVNVTLGSTDGDGDAPASSDGPHSSARSSAPATMAAARRR
jgi:hypothetical protein